MSQSLIAEASRGEQADASRLVEETRFKWSSFRSQLAQSRWKKLLSTKKSIAVVSRTLLAAYFINLTGERLEVWWRLHGVQPVRRWTWDDAPDPNFNFPYLWVMTVFPTSLMVMAGIQVVWSALVLLAACILQDAYLTWRQVVNIFMYGGRPNELVMKRLAVTGAALMVVAHAAKRSPQLRTYAGLLMGDDSDEEDEDVGILSAGGARGRFTAHPSGPLPQTGWGRSEAWRSAVLLVGRVCVSLLMLFSGWTQFQRIRARGWVIWQPHNAQGALHHGIKDSHDNTWLLAQIIMALPLCVGFKMRWFGPALVFTLLGEAVTCWPPWYRHYPSWYYSAHVRLHFFTNLALLGGILMLQRRGPGKFSIDELLKKQD